MSATDHGFQSYGFLKDRIICYRHDLKQALFGLARRIRGQPPLMTKTRISARRAKQLVLREKLAISGGAPSWFYTAYERGESDPLTNYALRFIVEEVPHSSRILVTGCGTGITAFHLADAGFREIVGFDLIPETIAVANSIKREYGYMQTSFFVDDGFKPKLDGMFDLITAMHWTFSAWSGNYGNSPVSIEHAKNPALREKLLNELIAAYAPHLNQGGHFIIELTDAVTDYRLPSDHRLGEASTAIYPVRHTPEQVERCAKANGLEVSDRKLCVSYGHHPRTSYRLRKA